MVVTPNGNRTIESLKSGDEIVAMARNERREALSSKIAEVKSSVNETVAIEFENGKELRVTPNHLFATRDRGWVRADRLENGEILKVLQKDVSPVKTIRKCGQETFYSLKIDGKSGFFVDSPTSLGFAVYVADCCEEETGALKLTFSKTHSNANGMTLDEDDRKIR